MCVYSNESVLSACLGARPVAEMPRVQECGIRSVSVVGVVFLGSDAPVMPGPTMNPRVVGFFPGNQRHPPGPAAMHERFCAFLADVALCSPAGPASRPTQPRRGDTLAHVGTGRSQSLVSLLPLGLAHGSHVGLSMGRGR